MLASVACWTELGDIGASKVHLMQFILQESMGHYSMIAIALCGEISDITHNLIEPRKRRSKALRANI